MKLHLNAKLCLILLYGCAFVCQTYAAAFTVDRIPNEPEEHNFVEDNSKAPTEESEKFTYGTAHAVPEEINLGTANEDKVTTEKSEDYTISPPVFTTEETNLNTDSPPSTGAAVTDPPKTGKLTIEKVWESCSKFRICIDGVCRIRDCKNTWEPAIFNPITKRCTRPFPSRRNYFLNRDCGSYPFRSRYDY